MANDPPRCSHRGIMEPVMVRVGDLRNEEFVLTYRSSSWKYRYQSRGVALDLLKIIVTKSRLEPRAVRSSL